MEKTRKITTILVLAVAFCFVLVSLAQAEGTWQTWMPYWAKKNLPNSQQAVGIPIWQITRPGTDKSVCWVDHKANPRFAIYDHMGNNIPGDETTFTDDLVLDKETGLVWTRDSNIFHTMGINPPDGGGDGTMKWQSAVNQCRDLNIGNRKGWRLPAVEELASLVDPSKSYPALPSGHPFINLDETCGYWSYTTNETDPSMAWCVAINWIGPVYNDGVKDATPGNFVWPVRGGN